MAAALLGASALLGCSGAAPDDGARAQSDEATLPPSISSAEPPSASSVAVALAATVVGRPSAVVPRIVTRDRSGLLETVSTTGSIDLGGAFFHDFGTNGRSCGTCHQPQDGWTVNAAHVRERFEESDGLDPIFRTVDGSNSPLADVSTVEARRAAYSQLLDKGLIRVGLPVPAAAEYDLVAADDPYHFASAKELSLFRRPPPSTNLRFLTGVMWDGRESKPGLSLVDALMNQANDATTGHAQADTPLSEADRLAIVNFEMTLATAQLFDHRAGLLDAFGAKGGPARLLGTPFYLGTNDVFGHDPTGKAFDPAAMTLFAPWAEGTGHACEHHEGRGVEARERIARGEALFNTFPIRITGVKGINDDLGQAEVKGTCTTCHDSPNIGNHSLPAPLDIGLVAASRRTPDMPLYTFRNKATGETLLITDGGRGLITGKWKDLGRFKGPVLRGLAARAPYFHNGFAKDLAAVVGFYDERFALGLSDRQKEDLEAFLGSL